MLRSVRLSLCPSVRPFVCPMAVTQKRCILGLWLLQNTNRKRHAGSQTHWSTSPYGHQPSAVAAAATKTSQPVHALITLNALARWRGRNGRRHIVSPPTGRHRVVFFKRSAYITRRTHTHRTTAEITVMIFYLVQPKCNKNGNEVCYRRSLS